MTQNLDTSVRYFRESLGTQTSTVPLWPRLIASFLLRWWPLCWSQAVLFYCSDPGPWIGSSSNLLAAASLGAHKPSPTALGSHVAQTEKATSCRTERQSLAQPRLGLITFSFPDAFDGFKKDIRAQIEVYVFSSLHQIPVMPQIMWGYLLFKFWWPQTKPIFSKTLYFSH